MAYSVVEQLLKKEMVDPINNKPLKVPYALVPTVILARDLINNKPLKVLYALVPTVILTVILSYGGRYTVVHTVVLSYGGRYQ